MRGGEGGGRGENKRREERAYVNESFMPFGFLSSTSMYVPGTLAIGLSQASLIRLNNHEM